MELKNSDPGTNKTHHNQEKVLSLITVISMRKKPTIGINLFLRRCKVHERTAQNEMIGEVATRK